MEQTNSPVLDNVIKNNRLTLQKYSKYFGLRIYQVKRENVDLTYNKKLQNGEPSLTKPLFKFRAKPIDIFNIELCGEDASGEPCIVFNNDVNLRFPVKKPEFFKEVEPATVKEAVDSKEPIYFSDIEKLNKEIYALNMVEFRKASALAEEFTKQATLLSTLNQQNLIDTNEYLAQIHKADAADTEIVIEEHTKE